MWIFVKRWRDWEGGGEAGPKAQGEEGKAWREGGLKRLIETDDANAKMDVEKVAPAQTMSNLEAGAEGSSLVSSQVYCPCSNGSISLKSS